MSGLDWGKARKGENADRRVTGLDVHRDPDDEMREVTRLRQARQEKSRPPKARLEAVDVSPDLSAQAAVEARQKGRLIDQALTFEERKANALRRHAEKTGKPAPESPAPATPAPQRPPRTRSERAQRHDKLAERKILRAAKAERSKQRAEWRKTLPPDEAQAKIDQLRTETKAARKQRREVRRNLPPHLAEAMIKQLRAEAQVSRAVPAAGDDVPPWE